MITNIIWKELPYSSSEDRFYHTSTLFEDYIMTFSGYSQKLRAYLGIRVLNLNKSTYEDFILEGDQPWYCTRHSKEFSFGIYYK